MIYEAITDAHANDNELEEVERELGDKVCVCVCVCLFTQHRHKLLSARGLCRPSGTVAAGSSSQTMCPLWSPSLASQLPLPLLPPPLLLFLLSSCTVEACPCHCPCRPSQIIIIIVFLCSDLHPTHEPLIPNTSLL
jgi:hypothetical protein